jgi:hypothetical protein
MADGKQRPATERPSEEAIAHRAYELYLHRGSVSGYELEDWLQAEAELTAAASRSRGSDLGAGDGQQKATPIRSETVPAQESRRNGRERNSSRRAFRS